MAGGVVDPAGAWAAASGAVRALLGALPDPARVRGDKPPWNSDRTEAWRLQLTIYTAVVGLNAGARPIEPFTRVSRRRVRQCLSRVEDLRTEPAIDALLDILAREAVRRLEGARA